MFLCNLLIISYKDTKNISFPQLFQSFSYTELTLEKIIGELNEVKATMQTSNEGTEAIRQLLQAVREQTAKQLPAPELIAKAAEEKVRAEMKSEEQAKELQVLQEENDRLRNEIKVLQEYKEKAHRELCRVRDEQKTFGKIKVKTEFNL